MTEIEKNTCPCDSGHPEASCCGPVIEGLQSAASAEALMRSRYTAYVRGDREYLLKTWHPKHRPAELTLEDTGLHWTGLQVLQTEAGQPGDTQGVVEFIARYERAGNRGMVQERSRFLYVQGHWLYLDGDLKSTEKPGRNSSCPCGSRKKYKRCCGRS
ncbi:MAG: YchJ family protein [Gammaproteobacteria bacterium]